MDNKESDSFNSLGMPCGPRQDTRLCLVSEVKMNVICAYVVYLGGQDPDKV